MSVSKVDRSFDQKVARGSFGSAAPVRSRRMQPFGTEIVETVGRPPRTTAVAISDLPGGSGEGQVPK